MSQRLIGRERYTGQMGLIERLGLRWPTPFVLSTVGAGSRRTVVEPGRTVERFTTRYDYGDSAVGDLKFAFRNEPLDLGLLRQAFLRIEPEQLEGWIAAEPTSAHGRRAWFLCELLTNGRLELADAARGNYVPALDPERHLVCGDAGVKERRSPRHRVIDNRLGSLNFCPLVRRTTRLVELMAVPVAEEARALIEGCDPGMLGRAVQYLLTKETRSSFEIEGERVDESRAERFVRALQTVQDFDPAVEEHYVRLQNNIVSDPRFHATGWRATQNFVGSVGPGYRQRIHYVCPRPRDVPPLMTGLSDIAWGVGASSDPVVNAALVSFGFVFVHPFDDGNGRIHRYLIHRMLTTGGVTPPGVLFPVSAAMLRDMRAYDAALESVSRRLMPFVEWRWVGGEGGGIEVLNDTLDLYRFLDATAVVEYLYERIIETVRKDLPEELAFVGTYDRTYRALTERFDGLPGPKVSLLATLMVQNGGRLASGKRRLFPMLTDAELAEAQELARSAVAEGPPTTPAAAG
jgi:hypothetical protein